MTEPNMIKYSEFIPALIAKVPDLKPLLDKHVEEQNGELLPHVLFGDITRYIQTELLTPALRSACEMHAVQVVLDALEEGLSYGDSDVKNLICASFLENVDPNDPGYETLVSMMGPTLRDGLIKFRE